MVRNWRSAMQFINYGQVQSINQLLPSSDVTSRVEFSDFSCGITGDVQAKTVPALTAAMATEIGKSHRKWISNSHRKDSFINTYQQWRPWTVWIYSSPQFRPPAEDRRAWGSLHWCHCSFCSSSAKKHKEKGSIAVILFTKHVYW